MRIHFLSKGPIDQISGGYLYNRYLVEHLRAAGVEVTYHASADALTQIEEGDAVLVDSIALLESAHRLLSASIQVVLLMHVLPDPRPLGPNGQQILAALYRRSRVVVTGDGPLTALQNDLALAGVDAVKIEPGVPGHWRTKGRYSDRARQLLGVANYLPGKGIARLIEVLSPLRDRAWTLTVLGNPHFDPDHYRDVRRMVSELGLADRIQLRGPIAHDGVNEAMLRSDLLVLLSQYESYSMATAEAIACGLPVLSYRTGDAESFERSGLVRHVDDGSEQEALQALIEHADDYARLRRTGPREVRTWEHVGAEFVDWLRA